MPEKPNLENYVHYPEHDIFFNRRLREKADEKNKKLKESGLPERVRACPMCKQELTLALRKIHSPQPGQEPFPFPKASESLADPQDQFYSLPSSATEEGIF